MRPPAVRPTPPLRRHSLEGGNPEVCIALSQSVKNVALQDLAPRVINQVVWGLQMDKFIDQCTSCENK